MWADRSLEAPAAFDSFASETKKSLRKSERAFCVMRDYDKRSAEWEKIISKKLQKITRRSTITPKINHKSLCYAREAGLRFRNARRLRDSWLLKFTQLTNSSLPKEGSATQQKTFGRKTLF
jgi:hypothetical protein